MFDQLKFEQGFNKAVKKLAASEKVSKEIIREVSRDALLATHATGDIAYINRFIGVLTPMTQKAAVLFFKEFSGFSYSADDKTFTKKDKKHYETKEKASYVFLDDPLNNLWTWADRNIEMEPKAFEVGAITKYMEVILKKAEKNHVSQTDVLKAVFASGFNPDAIAALMEEMSK